MKEDYEKEPQEGDDGEKKKEFKAQKVGPISLNNELKVLQRVKKECERALNLYPETYEDNIATLEKNNLSFNERNCYSIITSEKKV